MKRHLPSTSHDANKKATMEMRTQHHAKIIEALGHLGSSNYENIAAYCRLDRHQVGRRLSELERGLVVYKPGTTSKTKSGRFAYNYSLTEKHTLKVEHPVQQLIDKTKEAQEFMDDLTSGKLEHPIARTFQPQLF